MNIPKSITGAQITVNFTWNLNVRFEENNLVTEFEKNHRPFILYLSRNWSFLKVKAIGMVKLADVNRFGRLRMKFI